MVLTILCTMNWQCSMSTWNQFSFKSTERHLIQKKDMIIGVICRIPDTDVKYFNVKLSNILNQIRTQNKMVYLMGDYNINLRNSGTHEHTSEFVDILYSNEFLPLISRPTRITSNSATLIDNIMTT